MLRWLESRLLWGSLLILGGVVFLLQNLGILEFGELFWALLLGLGGLFFLSIFWSDPGNWWSLIPAFTLLSIAALITLEELAPRTAEDWGGSLIFGGIACSFLAIYLLFRENWWAIIPGGVLLTLAVVATLSRNLPGVTTGVVFFLGLGLTFLLVALLPTRDGAQTWAWIPAGILIFMALLFYSSAEELINYLWPVSLILAGSLMIWRTVFSRR